MAQVVEAGMLPAPYHGRLRTQQRQHKLPGRGHISYRITAPEGSSKQQQNVDVIFIHGLLSNMTGTKSIALEQHAHQSGHGFLSFDARGHGSSSGSFEETTIADWYQDAETALTLAPAQKHILVGSSFGGWQALHLAEQQPDQVAGLILIAPALDFTVRFWKGLRPKEQVAAAQQGRVSLGSNYVDGGQIEVGMNFFEDAKKFLVMDRLQELQVQCPVHILHGVQDDAVPVSVGKQLFEQLPAEDVVLTLIKDGDHRLSRPQDIRRLLGAVEDMLQRVSC